MDYKKLYFTLFNAVTDALVCLENQDPAGAASILVQAQQQAEELYISEQT